MVDKKAGFLLIEALLAALFFTITIYFVASTYGILAKINRTTIESLKVVRAANYFHENKGEKSTIEFEGGITLEKKGEHVVKPIIISQDSELIFDPCALSELVMGTQENRLISMTLLRFNDGKD